MPGNFASRWWYQSRSAMRGHLSWPLANRCSDEDCHAPSRGVMQRLAHPALVLDKGRQQAAGIGDQHQVACGVVRPFHLVQAFSSPGERVFDEIRLRHAADSRFDAADVQIAAPSRSTHRSGR